LTACKVSTQCYRVNMMCYFAQTSDTAQAVGADQVIEFVKPDVYGVSNSLGYGDDILRRFAWREFELGTAAMAFMLIKTMADGEPKRICFEKRYQNIPIGPNFLGPLAKLILTKGMPQMRDKRTGHVTAALPNGDVFVCGGLMTVDGITVPCLSAETFSVQKLRWVSYYKHAIFDEQPFKSCVALSQNCLLVFSDLLRFKVQVIELHPHRQNFSTKFLLKTNFLTYAAPDPFPLLRSDGKLVLHMMYSYFIIDSLIINEHGFLTDEWRHSVAHSEEIPLSHAYIKPKIELPDGKIMYVEDQGKDVRFFIETKKPDGRFSYKLFTSGNVEALLPAPPDTNKYVVYQPKVIAWAQLGIDTT
jgi:hypothetical protein